MSVILTPTPPVRFCIARLRQSVAETSRFSDQDLVDYINDGYQDACVRSGCLPAVTTVTVTAGAVEAALPADWAETLRVYVAGCELEPLPYQEASRTDEIGYYRYGATVGLTGGPSAEDVTLWVAYTRTPATLGLDDVPEWGGEWNYLLRHYAAWRCMLAASGAEESQMMVNERAQYDLGVNQLRGAVNRSRKSAQPDRVRTPIGA